MQARGGNSGKRYHSLFKGWCCLQSLSKACAMLYLKTYLAGQG